MGTASKWIVNSKPLREASHGFGTVKAWVVDVHGQPLGAPLLQD